MVLTHVYCRFFQQIFQKLLDIYYKTGETVIKCSITVDRRSPNFFQLDRPFTQQQLNGFLVLLFEKIQIFLSF